MSFFSQSNYVVLPNKNSPKVFLAVDDLCVKRKSFELYNPFKIRGKILKLLVYLFPFFNFVRKEGSSFIRFFEERMSVKLTSSVYFSTDNDKAVVQLQSKGSCVGYVKVALTEKGTKRLKNEYQALYQLKGVPKPELIDHGIVDGKYFILTNEVSGSFGEYTDEFVHEILSNLVRKPCRNIELKEHPRVLFIRKKLEEIDDINLLHCFFNLKLDSKKSVAYEHGDFAPWNIIKNDSGFYIIDFEYFFRDGLPGFDLIRYHFQVGRYLNGLSGDDLVKYLKSRVIIDNFSEMLCLYLLKEICLSHEELTPHDYELNILYKLVK